MAAMAAQNYNEVTHNKRIDASVMDPMYKWDSHFPEHITRLHINDEFHHNRSSSQKRRGGRNRSRNSNRYKTQPITFDEIKEVDEESSNKSTVEEDKDGLKSQFTAFSRSMDGLVGSYPPVAKKQLAKLSPLALDLQTMTENSEPSPTQTISIEVPRVPASHSECPIEKTERSQPVKSEPKIENKLASSFQEPGAVGSGPQEDVSTKELSAIGLKALPNLPQDMSRARRAKRRQKKGIEEEPELELARSLPDTGGYI